jgi:outer membrane protein
VNDEISRASSPGFLGCWLVALLLAGLGGALSGGAAAARDLAPGSVLGIEKAVRMALVRNREIEDARLALQVAEGQVREAWGEVYPKLDLTGSYTRNIKPQTQFLPASIFDPEAESGERLQVQFESDNLWSSRLSLEQPLFEARAFIGVGAAGRFRALQKEVLRGSAQAVATRVRLLYYQLLLLEEQARVTRDSLRRVNETLAETKALNRAGLVSDYDVLRLEVELANLIPGLRRAENGFAAARRELAVELDLADPGLIVLAGSLATLDLERPETNDPDNRQLLRFTGIDPAHVTPGLLRERLAADRSELRQLELITALRETDVRLERAEFLPRLALFGNYSITAQQDGRPVFFGDSEGRVSASAAGVSLTVPLFSGFQRTARVAQKRIEVHRAESELRLVQDRAEAQLLSLLDQFAETELRVQGQRLAVEMARRGFEIASAQYREGLGSRLELTDAEIALRQSELNYAEAVHDWLSTRALLDQAAGSVPAVDRSAHSWGE